MNYRRTFRELSDNEFIEYLERSEELTFEAQLHLLEVANERNLAVDSLISNLKEHVESEMEEVRSLKYINHLGFTVDTSKEYFTVSRSKATRNMDILGFVIGVLLSPNLYSAYISILELINNRISTVAVLIAVILTGLSFLSAALIYKCLNRIIEYRGFQLSKDSVGSIYVSKNSSNGSLNQTIDRETLRVSGDDTELSLVYSNGEREIELITTRGGIRAMETLKALHQQLI